MIIKEIRRKLYANEGRGYSPNNSLVPNLLIKIEGIYSNPINNLRKFIVQNYKEIVAYQLFLLIKRKNSSVFKVMAEESIKIIEDILL